MVVADRRRATQAADRLPLSEPFALRAVATENDDLFEGMVVRIGGEVREHPAVDLAVAAPADAADENGRIRVSHRCRKSSWSEDRYSYCPRSRAASLTFSAAFLRSPLAWSRFPSCSRP